MVHEPTADVSEDSTELPEDSVAEDVLVGGEDIAEEDVQTLVETPFGVGVLYTEVTTETGRVLPTTVWYPIAPDTEGDPYVYAGLIAGEAISDAGVADGGPWPLVLFSHGHSGVKEQSVFFTEHLAKNGYVVAAPDHVLNTFFDMDPTQTALIAQERPVDMSAVIDRFEAPFESDPAWFSTHVDLDLIAISGHSFGGYTSLAVAGATISVPQSLLDSCAENPDAFDCQLIDLDNPGPFDLSDSRVDVAIPMSPAGYAVFGAEGLALLERPTLIMTGKKDTATPYAFEVLPIFNAIGGTKYLWSLENADHFTFSDLCTVFNLLPPDFTAGFDANCEEDAPLTIEDAHPLIQKMSLAFLDYYLKGDESVAWILLPEGAEAESDEIELLVSIQ